MSAGRSIEVLVMKLEDCQGCKSSREDLQESGGKASFLYYRWAHGGSAPGNRRQHRLHSRIESWVLIASEVAVESCGWHLWEVCRL